jgi:hypothetical protein
VLVHLQAPKPPRQPAVETSCNLFAYCTSRFLKSHFVLRSTLAVDLLRAAVPSSLRRTAKTSERHLVALIEPRWTFAEVRRAAVALSRAVERRAPALASSKWWKEERHVVFLDYNQNAKDRNICSGYSVRPLTDARVSAPLHWHKVLNCDPADFTILTIQQRFAKIGNPHAGMDAEPGSLEKLLELADKDEAAGLGDAPWPPHFRKVEAEGPRVAPSRAKSNVRKPRVKLPLIVVANSPDKTAALAGLESMEEQTHRDCRFPCYRRRASRLYARQLFDLDPDPSQSAPRGRSTAAAARNSRP